MSGGLRVVLHGAGHRLVDTEGVPLPDVSRFLSALELRGLSPKTVRAYAFDLLSLYRWLGERNHEGETLCVENLCPHHMTDFIRYQREAGAEPASINRRLTVAGLCYRFLTGGHICAIERAAKGVSFPSEFYKGPGKDRNLGLHRVKGPAVRALRVKTPRKIVEPLTRPQVRRLLASFTRYRDIAIVYLMLLCGLRSSEVITLSVQDVDFLDRRLRVLGKGSKDRVLPLPALLAECLRDYLRLERPQTCREPALFVVLQGPRRGRGMTTDGLRSLFRNRRKDELIHNANPHRLRHTFGADMARAGAPLPTLQKMMGQLSPKARLRELDERRRTISA